MMSTVPPSIPPPRISETEVGEIQSSSVTATSNDEIALNIAVDDSAMQRVIRRNIIGAAISLVVLVVIFVTISLRFGAQVDTLARFVFDSVGLLGIVGMLFITDAFVSPLPPDSLLILIARSPHHANWMVIIPLIGLVSAVAGWTGFGLGRALADTALGKFAFGRLRERQGELIVKLGPTAVVLGALTPIPFSITCWSAGLLKVPFRKVWAPCLLRVPRYVVYYAAMSYSPAIFERLFR